MSTRRATEIDRSSILRGENVPWGKRGEFFVTAKSGARFGVGGRARVGPHRGVKVLERKGGDDRRKQQASDQGWFMPASRLDMMEQLAIHLSRTSGSISPFRAALITGDRIRNWSASHPWKESGGSAFHIRDRDGFDRGEQVVFTQDRSTWRCGQRVDSGDFEPVEWEGRTLVDGASSTGCRSRWSGNEGRH